MGEKKPRQMKLGMFLRPAGYHVACLRRPLPNYRHGR